MSRKLVNKEGTIAYINACNKLHNWDDFAYIPNGDRKKGEYYINGIRVTKEQLTEAKREWNGTPFYKNPSFQGENRF